MKRLPFFFSLFFLGQFILFNPGHAETADAQKATVIDSGSLSYDDLRQVTIFSNNVVLTRGSLILRADRLELKQDPEGYQTAVATANAGNLVYIRQKLDGRDELIEGSASRIEYDGRSDQIHLINQASVKKVVCGKPQDEVKAQRITYNQRTETYNAVGGPSAPTNNRLVRTVIQPQGNNNTGKSPC